MPQSPPVLEDVTTINYTLEWPHLENPSNTTFAGSTQIDICRCGSLNSDLGHVYTRYRCQRPEIRFATADEELWVLQAPLGQVNLLRPATSEELQRRRELHDVAEPNAYAGKNFLLLSGPCPRGRYQALATLMFLKSLSPAARQNVECLSLLIQPYEEDCSDDQGGRAYIDLAHYIIEELPNFKTLCLNIWGEETKSGSREFAMVLWKEAVKIVLSWDWWSEETEEYTDIDGFWKGIDVGVVKRRPVWEESRNDVDGREEDDDEGGHDEVPSSRSRSIAHELLIRMGRQREVMGWEEAPIHQDEGDSDMQVNESITPEMLPTQDGKHYDSDGEGHDDGHQEVADATTPTFDPASSEEEEDWSDAIMTPLSPATGEHGDWQIL